MPHPRCLCFGIALTIALCTPRRAAADVTITWRTSASDASGSQTVVESIRGERQREDFLATAGGPDVSVIRDLEDKRQYLIWHVLRRVRTVALTAETEDKEREAREHGGGKNEDRERKEARERKEKRERNEERERRRAAVAVRTGAVSDILGVRCREYRFAATSADGAFTLTGTYWMADKAPGASEFAELHRELSEFRVVDAEEEETEERNPTEGYVQLRRAFLAAAMAHGIPYRLAFEASGNTRQWRLAQEATGVSTTRIPAALFTVPAGYQETR